MDYPLRVACQAIDSIVFFQIIASCTTWHVAVATPGLKRLIHDQIIHSSFQSFSLVQQPLFSRTFACVPHALSSPVFFLTLVSFISLDPRRCVAQNYAVDHNPAQGRSARGRRGTIRRWARRRSKVSNRAWTCVFLVLDDSARHSRAENCKFKLGLIK